MNELFLDCTDVLLPFLTKLFNSVFLSGFFPDTWSTGCIIPIFKKGDCNDTNNYRGITLISCMGKLFTSVLNARLLKWDGENNIITDAQFGFRPGHSTVDAIFILQTLINKYLKKKGGRLYCCFVDYRKAFDFIDRGRLWGKLIKQGINGKMLNIIKSLYENVKSCVKHDGMLSDYFSNKIGLFQGEVLSPILYSLYVNDCEMHFLKHHCPYIELQLMTFFLLMYADDMVLIAESPAALQHLLSELYCYNNEWKLELNTDKTKIVVFRNGGTIKKDEKWFYNDTEIEVVNQFNYLGMLFNYNGKFSVTQKHIADQGRKAYFAVYNKLKNHCFNTETQLLIFDMYVNSILSYGAEVWGFHKAPDVEKVHSMFCKKLLGVKKNTCNNLVYFELGRLPLHESRKLKILKYMVKLKNSKNCILRTCFEERLLLNDDWIIGIRQELNKLGIGYILDAEYDSGLYKVIEQRFMDVYKQNILSYINESARGNLYRHLVDNFCLQFYLCKPIDFQYKKFITRFRISAHNLNIETGRYYNENRNNRLCTLCNLNDIEDEFHFILKCPFYHDIRIKYIKKYYYNRPSVWKLVQLLSVQNLKELYNLGKFLFLSSKRRNDII